MNSLFTEDFFKNVIGFATILIVGLGITAVAGGQAQPEQTATTAETSEIR